MLNEIAEKLSNHPGLSAWQIRRVKSRSSQLFLIAEDEAEEVVNGIFFELNDILVFLLHDFRQAFFFGVGLRQTHFQSLQMLLCSL